MYEKIKKNKILNKKYTFLFVGPYENIKKSHYNSHFM